MLPRRHFDANRDGLLAVGSADLALGNATSKPKVYPSLLAFCSGPVIVAIRVMRERLHFAARRIIRADTIQISTQSVWKAFDTMQICIVS